MTKEEFFKELFALKDENLTKEIIAKIKSHALPTVVFGAGQYAKMVADELALYDIKISGYSVDEKYYKPNKTYCGLPVFNFDEISKDFGKYVFVLGMAMNPKTDSPAKVERINSIMTNDKLITYDLFADKCESVSWDYISENKDKFWETYNLFEDNLSKKTMMIYLKSHITLNRLYIKNLLDETGITDEYFNEITAPAVCGGGGIYVDCGAFNGDSVEDFISFVGGKYKRIFAIEPDTKNFQAMQKLIEEKNYKNVSLYECGVWDKKETLTFSDDGTVGSAISESGNITVKVDSIDNIVGDSSVSLIKMDVEGAELKALQGATNTLKRSRPALALSAYHKRADLITIPQFIKNVYQNCKFYLRKHDRIDLWDFDLYVIPD